MTTLDEVADRLYDLPPEDFTSARNEAVAAARKAGDKKLASDIGALRRPTVGAWLVNLLAHRRPDRVEELLDLGETMRTAQRHLRGDELRQLATQRRKMIGSLAREAQALADRGSALPLSDVENTLAAALADPDIADQVRQGRLVKPIEYAGFGEQPRPQLRLVQGGGEDPKPSKAEREATAKAERIQQAAAERSAEKEAAAKERAAVREAAAEKRKQQQDAHRELLAARTALAEAESARTAAEKAVRDAKRRVEAALAAAEAARAE